MIVERCQHCNGRHEGACGRVKRIEFYPDGTIKKVEYFDSFVVERNDDCPKPDVSEEVWKR